MKRGDVNVVADDDDDDEVRTSASQYHATEVLCTEGFFLRTQYTVYSSPLISAVRCGWGYGWPTRHI
jgi:hypothetical protein